MNGLIHAGAGLALSNIAALAIDNRLGLPVPMYRKVGSIFANFILSTSIFKPRDLLPIGFCYALSLSSLYLTTKDPDLERVKKIDLLIYGLNFFLLTYSLAY